MSDPEEVATDPIGLPVNLQAIRPTTHVDFDAVFDAHYADLVRYCRRLTGDEDAAEDLAQESMFRLFGNEVRGGPGDLRAWLFTTATHLARDRFRVDRNRRRLLEIHPVRPAEREAPDQALERKERRTLARAGLDALKPRDREILLMRYSGFSYREIAEAVGVAASSIGTLLARAERRFAESVERTEDVA